MLGFKLSHVSKQGPRFQSMICVITVNEISAVRTFDLTHSGRVTHICVGNLTVISSDNGLSPGRRQCWTNAGILLIGPLGRNLGEILIEIHIFSYKKIHLKMSSGKWRPFCLGLNVLIYRGSHQLAFRWPKTWRQDICRQVHYSGVSMNDMKWVSHYQHSDCLLNHLFRRTSMKTSKLRVTGLCEGKSTRDRWISLTKGQ